ncbi:MAG: photosynthetic complex assembly protein PuhC [Sphingomonadaceae bacterium]|nr:photosynthetic complex assembly protein PuhC [Sphingomonadaceae bacterium]
MNAAEHHDEIPVPRSVLWAAAGVIGLTLACAAGVRSGLLPAEPTAAQLRVERHVSPVAVRTLRFGDDSGAVAVTDAATGRRVAMLKGDSAGFVRGVMRALARERLQHKLGAETPFRLTQWTDGELTLVDLATGRTVELSGFGTTNRAAFAALLKG